MRRELPDHLIIKIKQSSMRNTAGDEKLSIDDHERTVSTKIPESAEGLYSNSTSNESRIADPFSRS